MKSATLKNVFFALFTTLGFPLFVLLFTAETCQKVSTESDTPRTSLYGYRLRTWVVALVNKTGRDLEEHVVYFKAYC